MIMGRMKAKTETQNRIIKKLMEKMPPDLLKQIEFDLAEQKLIDALKTA